VKAVFLEALEQPESERGTFIERATAGDHDLRAQVRSLLDNDGAAGDFCETPAAALLGREDPALALAPQRLAPGTRLGVYEVVAFIAAGGMGEVYRARHTILGRDVAIKTVSATHANEASGRRLIREARHASVLSHPNICTSSDVGVVGDVPFIVMQYVDGEPLHQILRRGVLPLARALDYAVQIASALAHAHAQGIIHRDLKSSNVVVDTEGKPVVLDFGLARRLPDGAGAPPHNSTLTGRDEVAGTVSHMAPEILRGQPADARSDIWSLGVLLYELVTSELPFHGRTSFEMSSAILGEPARPVVVRVPLAVRLVIERCLAKDPDARYQHAAEIRDALDTIRRRHPWLVAGRLLFSARPRTITTAVAVACLIPIIAIAGRAVYARFATGGVAPATTLALLPLRNETGDPRAAYYADGVSDAIIAQLGAAGEVRVLSRASTTRAASWARSAEETGAALGADVVVDGALHEAGRNIRVEMRVIVPSTRQVVWSRTFERTASEILALQADVVRAVASAVRVTLRPGASERLTAVRAVSPAVYEEYLKGRYEWNRRTPASLKSAIDHFTRAAALDPSYAPAHAALADCLNLLGTVMLGGGSPRELRPRAEAEAIRALQLDPSSAEARAALGYVWHYDWRFADAEREFRRAIELNPSYSMARIWYANLLMSRERMPEALKQVFAARELDPFSLIVQTNVGWVLDRAGRHDDAVAQLERTLTIDSTYVQARWRLAAALMNGKRFDEAIAQGQSLIALSDSAPPSLALVAQIEARAGRPDAARALLAAARRRAHTSYLPPASEAAVFSALGEVDSAMTWLEKAFAERSNAIVYLAGDFFDPPLRRDPRFQALVARVGSR